MRSVLQMCAASLLVGCAFDGVTPIESADSDAGVGESDATIDPADAAQIPDDAAPACATLPTGALAWWDGDGVLGRDVLGNHAATSTFGSPETGPGLVGNSHQFDDDEDIIVGDPPQSAAFTIEGWIVRQTDDVGYQTVYGNEFDAGLFLLDHRLVYYDDDGPGVNNDILTGNITVELDTYTHVAATYDGTTLSLYFNGTLDTYTSTGVDISLPTTGRLGGVNAGDGQDLVGEIDELTVYDRALEAAELLDIAMAAELGKCKPPGS